MPEIGMHFKNNKNGKVYCVVGSAINCTNAQDGQTMVLYFQKGNLKQSFVREKSEFLAKFTRETE